MGKYLLLGSSSDICCTFLKQHLWHEDDEIIAQYFHNKNELIEIQKKISVKMNLVQVDFNDGDSTNKFTEFLIEYGFIPTHILHVPAVRIVNQRFTEITWDDTMKQLNVQCRSLMLVLQTVIKKMSKAKKGKIIIGLSSCSLNVPPKYLSSYVMAKYALMGLGKALASEYASRGIQVNMFSPSMMETKFLHDIHNFVIEQSAAGNPMKRNAAPKDVCGIIEYLFSEKNTFITGANIPVTGGEIF